MGGNIYLDIGTYLISIASKSVYKVQCRDSVSWYCYSAVSSAYGMCLMLRYHYNTRSIMLSDIFASDYIGCNMRFLISYNVYSLLYNIRLLLSVFINDLESIMSLTSIYPCAN
jgi:NADH:ubiquinone oxidoreductase subunit C